MEDTQEIVKDGKRYFIEWDKEKGHIALTECGEHPEQFEMLETYDFYEHPYVKVEVFGGIADVTENKCEVNVEIIDNDNCL